MNQTTKTFTVIIGIIMTIAMVGSLILPMLTGNIGQADFEAEEPTPYPEPTMPAPPDISAINYDSRYLHDSGLFTLSVPSGWTPGSSSNTSDELRASLNNSEYLSVLEARIIQNHDDIADLAGLDAMLDKTWLNQSWSGYTSWHETSRKTLDDKVQIDFNLARGRSRMIARQESWLEDGQIYSARVVMAENAARELKAILKSLTQSIEGLPMYAGAPFGYTAYYDNMDKHILRYPSQWQVSDAAPGQPATISGDGLVLTVGSHPGRIGSEDEAANWVEAQRSGISAHTAQTVEVAGAPGYRVSYLYTSLDGELASGLSLLLNGEDERLHVASLRISNINEDLLNAEESGMAGLEVLDSFRLTPELDIDLQ